MKTSLPDDNIFAQGDIETGKKSRFFPAGRKEHTKELRAVAVTEDGNIVAAGLCFSICHMAWLVDSSPGGVDKILRVFDTRANQLVESFKGHRDIISVATFFLLCIDPSLSLARRWLFDAKREHSFPVLTIGQSRYGIWTRCVTSTHCNFSGET